MWNVKNMGFYLTPNKNTSSDYVLVEENAAEKLYTMRPVQEVQQIAFLWQDDRQP